jgi:hypothetical protein
MRKVGRKIAPASHQGRGAVVSSLLDRAILQENRIPLFLIALSRRRAAV